MKKIIVLIIGISILSLIIKPIKVSAEEQNRILVLNDIVDVEDYFTNENYQVLQFSERIEYLYGSTKTTIKGQLLAYLFNEQYLYLLVKDDNQKLIQINEGKLIKETIISEDILINKIVYDNTILLFGSYKTSGIILEYNNQLHEVKRHLFGNGNDLVFIDAVKYYNNWYVIATKNGHSVNDEFRNVGNHNDIKTILIKLNSKYLIDNVLYINNEEPIEIPNFLKYYNNNLYFGINTKTTSYFYKTDMALEECYDIGSYEIADAIMLGYNGEILRFNLDNSLMLYEQDKKIEYTIFNVVSMEISDSILKVYTNENNNIYLYEIEEYHINYINEFNIGYDYGDYDFAGNLNNNDVISIESYFSEVKVFNETPFTNHIPGTYEISLVIKRPNLNNIQIATKVNVNDYVNIIDKGVYKTGITLKFLGIAKLNNQEISNGYIILEEGDYQLSVQDNQGNTSNYHFACVDNYYVGSINEKYTNFYLQKNQSAYIDFFVESTLNVQEVVIDNHNHQFTQKDQVLSILVDADNIYNNKEYTLQKIKVDDKWYFINHQFKVMTLKTPPQITIEEVSNDTLLLKAKIIDYDKTIQKFGLIINGKEEQFNYLKDELYSLDINLKEKVSIELNIYYDLGDGVIKTLNLIKFNGTLKEAKELIALSFNITHSLEEVEIKLDTGKVKKLEYLKVNGSDVTTHYANKHNYTNIYISVVASLVVIIIIIIIFIGKKKKFKKQK